MCPAHKPGVSIGGFTVSMTRKQDSCKYVDNVVGKDEKYEENESLIDSDSDDDSDIGGVEGGRTVERATN